MPDPTRVSGGRAPKLEFPVTADLIEAAIPADSAHCMIADALRAALPEARHVSVDLATIRYTDPKTGRRYIYLTPAPAQVALLDFDQGIKPEPFTVKAHAAQILLTKAGPKETAATKERRTTAARAVVAARREEEERLQVEIETEDIAASASVAGSIPTFGGAASPSVAESVPASESSTSASLSSATEETPKGGPQRATLIPNPAGGGTVPIKFGGYPPPLGALARGVGTKKTGPRYRTGRVRSFGLRVMGH